MKTNRILTVLLTVLMPLAVLAVVMAQEDGGEPKGMSEGQSINSVASSPDGGPDAFGYTFADSSGTSCSYQFVDISITGTAVLTGDDTSTASPPPDGISSTIPLTAPFVYYGYALTEMVMASNGYLTNDPLDLGPDLSNDCPLPAPPSTPTTTNGARMYPLHDDLVLDGANSTGYVQDFEVCPRPDDTTFNGPCTIFQWNNVHHYNDTITFTFQAILYHYSGEIVYQYDDRNPEQGSGSTTGIQDFAPPTSGLTYACNITTTVSNSAVCFFPPAATIVTTKTVTLSPPNNNCQDNANFVRVPAGTNVYFCYEVHNTGGMALIQHTLQDSELGTLLSDFPYSLDPNNVTYYEYPVSTTITQSVTNHGQWIAEYADVAAYASDAATVIVDGPNANLSCNGPTLDFNSGVPANWEIVSNFPQGPVWGDLLSCEENDNYTGGDGGLLCASSDRYGVEPYDTEIRSSAFDVPNEPQILLRYLANYQRLASTEYLDLDISTDNGTNWTTLLQWNEDTGAFRDTPGEEVVVDLSAYTGVNGVILRWHYYNTNTSYAWDWYAQVDDVSLRCGNYQLYLPTVLKS